MYSNKTPKHNSIETPRSAMAAGGSAVAGLATNSARHPDTPETPAVGLATAAAHLSPLDGTAPLDEAEIERWSPDRDRRAELNKMKVVSLEDGNIRGGHWVLNKKGDSCTIAFLWKNSGGRIFGLTSGHSFGTIGDPVFVFLHSEPTPTTYEDHQGFVYEMMEVGEVVSISRDTDSIVFEVTCNFVKHRFDLLKLDPRSGLGDRELRLPRPSLHPSPPTDDSKVIFWGAQSRGKRCIVSTPRNGDDESWLLKHAQLEKIRGYSEENEIGFELEAGPTGSPTCNGDCGALFLDYLTGFPLAMHHALVHFNLPGDDEPEEYEAYGFPLSLIMAKHPEQFAEMFGPLKPAAIGDTEQDETTRVQPSDGASGRWLQATRTTRCFQVQKFNVTIPENPVIPDPATGVGIRKAVDPIASGSIIRRSKAERDARKRLRTQVGRCYQIQRFNVTVASRDD